MDAKKIALEKTRTADLYTELKLLDTWQETFPEERFDADGVKARQMRRAEIVRELDKRSNMKRRDSNNTR